MRYPPTEHEADEVAKLNAEPWMLELLDLNPDYVSWGPYEDYMCAKGDGWNSRVVCENWADFSFSLDDLNEVVNFYFDVERTSCECSACGGSGLSPGSKEIADAWYDFGATGKRWCDKLTQDEADALWTDGRLKHDFPSKPTAEQVNEWERGPGFGHDAINRMICVRTRAKRLGVWGYCSRCDGDGYVYTAPAATVGLVLWVLHPRKGCSRGVHIKALRESDLASVFEYLRQAQARNHQRFSKLPTPSQEAGDA